MSPALNALLHWVTEREKISLRLADWRGKGNPQTSLPPKGLTKDPILATYRFCNVRREDDLVTRWIAKHIRKPFAKSPYLWFMLCIARQINWPETLAELIGNETSWPDHSAFDPAAMGWTLEERALRGEKVFTGAYIITAPSTKGLKKTHFVAEQTLGALWEERASIIDLFARFAPIEPPMQVVHKALMKFKGWGPFLAYQAVVDMRFTRILGSALDRYEWAAAGPGTIRGLNRIAGRPLTAPLSQEQALSEMRALAPMIRKKTKVDFDFSDVPNILCETDKYLRVKNGEGKPRALYVPGRGL